MRTKWTFGNDLPRGPLAWVLSVVNSNVNMANKRVQHNSMWKTLHACWKTWIPSQWYNKRPTVFAFLNWNSYLRGISFSSVHKTLILPAAIVKRHSTPPHQCHSSIFCPLRSKAKKKKMRLAKQCGSIIDTSSHGNLAKRTLGLTPGVKGQGLPWWWPLTSSS